MYQRIKWIATIIFAAALGHNAFAQDPIRKELKRGDLTGTNMEIIIGTSELKPGTSVARHIHHGEEALYVMEGGTIELPDGKQIPLPAGDSGINVRDIPHGGFKVVGDKTMKIVTVHIVDKGKPLNDTPR